MNLALKAINFFKIFINQLINPLTYVLLLAAAIIFVLGTLNDAVLIISSLLFSALLGTIKSYYALDAKESFDQTRLQANLKQLSFFILIFISTSCLCMFLIGLLTGKPLPELLSMLVALFICVVPECLPIALKISTSQASFKQVILFFFATNFGQILIVFGALLANLPIPILATQFLWLNLVTDGLLSTSLALEPVDPKVLSDRDLIDRAIIYKVVFMGLIKGACGLAIFLSYYHSDLTKARTMVLLFVVLCQLFNVWGMRSQTKSVLELEFFANKYLLVAMIIVFSLQLSMIYLPFLQNIFHTCAISAYELLTVMLIASVILLLEELRKFINRAILKA